MPSTTDDKAKSRRSKRGESRNAVNDDIGRLLEVLLPNLKQKASDGLAAAESAGSTLETPQARLTAVNPTFTDEIHALEQFSKIYHGERDFSRLPQRNAFSQFLTCLVRRRLCSVQWMETSSAEHVLVILTCVRMMLRDSVYQKELFQSEGVKTLTFMLTELTDSYITHAEKPYLVDQLKELANVFHKVTIETSHRDWLVACGVHKPLVHLLTANDVYILHCALHALINLAKSDQARALIGELNSVEMLLRILQDYDLVSKRLASDLLRKLCSDECVREQVTVFDGVPVCLSLLHLDDVFVLMNAAGIIERLAYDSDARDDIRVIGGLPSLLTLLQLDRLYGPTAGATNPSSSAGLVRGLPHSLTSAQIPEDDKYTVWNFELRAAVCTALTVLFRNDINAQHVIKDNGAYTIALLILPQATTTFAEATAAVSLQKTAFRALRFLFSKERNRQLFRRLLPPALFERFIDAGHYNFDLNAYSEMASRLTTLQEEELLSVKSKIEAINQHKAPSHRVGKYEVMEHLGSGAFGSVYRVRSMPLKDRHFKLDEHKFYAMKEIYKQNPAFGKTPREQEKSIGKIISEVSIMQEKLRHPNVVRYYSAFTEGEKLFVVMELLDGAPLSEHFNSKKEKKEWFSEESIWNIYVQIILALRYIHKEKRIVHRDLTPGNIMLGENDRVTITDFGLAKQKPPDTSVLTSVVGTILYHCPELIQGMPYGEKADIWAAGCILYQMATLEPPFICPNVLSLATRIVEVQYKPIPEGRYSDRIKQTVKRCLCADPSKRPDILQLAGSIADVLLLHIDQITSQQTKIERQLQHERHKIQQHKDDSAMHRQKYERLFHVSQERCGRLHLIAGRRRRATLESVDDYGKKSNGDAGASSSEDETAETAGREDRLAESATSADSVFASPNSTDDSIAGLIREIAEESSEPEATTVAVMSGDGKTKAFLSRMKRSLSGSRVLDGGGGVIRDRRHSQSTSPPSSANQSRPLLPRPPSTVRGTSRRPLPLESFASNRHGAVAVGFPLDSPTSSGTVSLPGSGRRRRSASGTASESGVVGRKASGSAAMLTISPRKVRPISDPIQQILNQLHKIVFVTQLPPSLKPSPRRRLVEKFKREIFSQNSSSTFLKSVMRKLVSGSKEIVDLNFGGGTTALTAKISEVEEAASTVARTGEEQGSNVLVSMSTVFDSHEGGWISLTYEQLQVIIESVLVESGYYDVSSISGSKSAPLGPIPLQGIGSARIRRPSNV
eukprot:m.24293 g.24293  ORF g.24293 m.24293 type:complete len:1244 (+) comp28597_c0_seq1:262-3993(+)